MCVHMHTIRSQHMRTDLTSHIKYCDEMTDACAQILRKLSVFVRFALLYLLHAWCKPPKFVVRVCPARSAFIGSLCGIKLFPLMMRALFIRLQQRVVILLQFITSKTHIMNNNKCLTAQLFIS